MNRGTKRQKGGAEKKIDKIKKALLFEGEKCAKLDSFFQANVTPTAASANTSSIDVSDTGELAEEEYVQEEENEQEGDDQDMEGNDCNMLLFHPPAVKTLHLCLQQYMVGIRAGR